MCGNSMCQKCIKSMTFKLIACTSSFFY